VFENRVLRRIFGPEKDEVTGEWRKLHSEELHNLNSSPNIIRQIKLRRMKWEGHVARMGEEIRVYKVWWETPKERDHSEVRGVDGRMRSEWILGPLAGGVELIGSGRGPVAGCCKCGDEPSGSGARELVF
jgi:hypothetical protein